MYKVIERFRDLTDGHLYEVGEEYPYDSRNIDADRLSALETGRNLSCKALIAKVEETPAPAVEQPKKATRTRKKA